MNLFNFETESLPTFVKSITTISWCVFIGIIIAGISSIYNKRMIGSFVRHLLKSNATSEESAIKLSETEFVKKRYIVRALKKNIMLNKVVRRSGDSKGKITVADIKDGSYYVPDELRYKADTLYDSKGTNWVMLVVSIITFFIVISLSLLIIPQLLDAISGVFTSSSGSDAASVDTIAQAETTVASLFNGFKL